MKKVLFLLLFVFLFTAVDIGIADENLLKNGSFEDISGGLPRMWSTDIYDNDYNNVRFFVENKGAYDGNNYITIENIRPDDARLIQTVKVKPNTIYRLSCRIKAEGIGKNALGASITELYILEASKDFKDTGGKWEYVELYGRTGKKQDNIAITARLGGYGNVNTGKASFDDFRLEQVGNPPAGVNVINLYRENDALQQKSMETHSSIFAVILDSLLFAGLLFAAYYSIFKQKQTNPPMLPDETLKHSAFMESGQIHFSKTDHILMWSLTLAYAVIVLINLGSLKVPQSFWKPANKSESFYADIGKLQDIDRVYYFLSFGKGAYKIDFSEDGQTWQDEKIIEQKSVYEMVEWRYFRPGHNARYIRITTENPGAMLNEIGFFNPNSTKPILIKSIVKIYSGPDSPLFGKPENVFDEQNKIAYSPGFLNGMYFDEVYHARTAYESLHKMEPTETTHPPLGKIIISLGIAVFGMTPFGWRIMGALFGVAMVPLMYLFGMRVFKKTEYAFISSFLFTFDFMHFSLSRIATIDIFAVFFIIVMYYYMYKYFEMNFFETGLKQTLVPLLLCGIFFGLGLATKWITLYGGLGLAVVLFTFLGLRFCEYRKAREKLGLKSQIPKKDRQKNESVVRSFPRYTVLTLLWCVLAFVLIPAVIYIMSYIPFMMVPGPGHEFSNILTYQKHMYDYHSRLQAAHPFFSSWWEWPIMRKPVWCYMGQGLPAGKISSIIMMGNPAVWWTGSLATIVTAVIALCKKEKGMYVILIGAASLYLPWTVASRKLLFIYHFFATVPFIVLCATYFFMVLRKKFPKFKCIIYIYLAAVLILFVIFYPVLSGMIVSKSYVAAYLRWFNSWIFF
jgi:predicted membrane-bound dolichyl-phosphate-mannose-protein mannosyltransferase